MAWTVNQIILSPIDALREIERLQAKCEAHDARVTELLNANNRYLKEARAARREINAVRERILGYRE